jgi:D-alanine-D-alanine ligase
MRERRGSLKLAKEIEDVAVDWEIPLRHRSSLAPSAAGLVPEDVAAVCGVGPTGRDLGTPHEAIERISLIQHTLLLTQFLAKDLPSQAKTTVAPGDSVAPEGRHRS